MYGSHIPPQFIKTFHDFVQESARVAKEASQLAHEVATERQQVGELSDEVTRLLLAENLIQPTGVNVIKEKLASHTGALEIISNLVSHVRKYKEDALKLHRKQASDIGEPYSANQGRIQSQDQRPTWMRDMPYRPGTGHPADKVFEGRFGF